MKKKIVILVIVCLFLVVGIIGFIFWNNRTVSTITLDINPSIEINLDRNEKIKSIVALNYDAKVLISNDYKSKNIDEVLMEISEKIIDNVDNDGKEYVILLHIDGELSEDKVSEKLVSLFEERQMPVNVIVPKVTKEDEKKAKELGITPAKAAYLSEVVKSNNDLKIEDIKDKSVSELNEMKDSGNYCDTGYTLHGDKCYKEINRVAAINGEVCPTGYYEKNEKCYEQKEPVENNNYVCPEGLKLFNDECILENTYDAKGKCDSGDYDNGYCVVKEYIGEGKEYCRITPA